jgi:hypothetical protein
MDILKITDEIEKDNFKKCYVANQKYFKGGLASVISAENITPGYKFYKIPVVKISHRTTNLIKYQ